MNFTIDDYNDLRQKEREFREWCEQRARQWAAENGILEVWGVWVQDDYETKLIVPPDYPNAPSWEDKRIDVPFNYIFPMGD